MSTRRIWPLLLVALATLPACGSPDDRVVARWDLWATDGVPTPVTGLRDRYTFWESGGVDRRDLGGVTRHGTLELEDDFGGRLIIRYEDGGAWDGRWIVVDCPPSLPHEFSCRLLEFGGVVELRAPGF